jgi:hypothetical protein
MNTFQRTVQGMLLSKRAIIETQFPQFGNLAMPMTGSFTAEFNFDIAFLAFVLPTIAWFLLIAGVFYPAFALQERNWLRVTLIGSVIDPAQSAGEEVSQPGQPVLL